MLIILKYFLSFIIWIIFWINATLSITFLILISFVIPKKWYNPIVSFVCRFLMYSTFIYPKIYYKSKNEKPFPVIYVANHVSFFDLFISGSVLDGYPRGLELKSHFDKPIYGWFITRFGEIPLDTKNKHSIKESFLSMANILKNRERCILIMPEGTRTRDGKIGKFKIGAFHLSKISGIPIVPVVFKKLYEKNNPNSFLITPGKFEVHILDKIDPNNFETDDAISTYTKEVMEKILES